MKHQSVYKIVPLGLKATNWIEKNLLREKWNSGYCVAVEWRYIEAIYEAMTKAGLNNRKDFLIS